MDCLHPRHVHLTKKRPGFLPDVVNQYQKFTFFE